MAVVGSTPVAVIPVAVVRSTPVAVVPVAPVAVASDSSICRSQLQYLLLATSVSVAAPVSVAPVGALRCHGGY